MISQLHDDIITTTSRSALLQPSLSSSATNILFALLSHNTATMFRIGPNSSSSGSEPSSRDISPSKGSEWSTTSDHETDPKTPQKRVRPFSTSEEAYWSDDSDTPVKPRTARRRGHVYTRNSRDEEPLAASDERSLLTFDDGIFLSSSDSRSDFEADSGSDPEFEKIKCPRPENLDDNSERELPSEFANAEEWISQHDTGGIDPLKLGEVPVRPLPPVSCSI
jgi:hypothetical protein